MLSAGRPAARRSRRSVVLLATCLVTSGLPRPSHADQVYVLDVAPEVPALKGLPAAGEVPAPMVETPERLDATQAVLGQGYTPETEPNGTTATATFVPSSNVVFKGNILPNGDVDFYRFDAEIGDRVHIATMMMGSAGSSQDSQLTLLDQDGTTVLEFDDDNGSFGQGFSSSIAGAPIPATGTYFIRVNDFALAASERPYELHFRLQDAGTPPMAETEPNNTSATANPLPSHGWVSGTRDPAGAVGVGDVDFFSLNLQAGESVHLQLDLDPERDAVSWNGRLGFGLFGDTTNQILVVDDPGGTEGTGNPIIPSEAMFFTVKTTGTYFAYVDSAGAAVGGPTATYRLSVTVHPVNNEGVNCTTYDSTDVPKTIGPNAGLTSSVIVVPGNPRIQDVDVTIVLNHAVMQDIDAHLRTPAGNDNGLFTDIGAATTGGQTQMDATFDDEAALIPAFTALRGIQVKPENASTATLQSGQYRLSWLDGENAGGTWTLDLRDDTSAGGNGGTLTAWSIRICEPFPPPPCAVGQVPVTVFSTDFESGAAGFTHSGAQDEWELGLPATVATATANPVAPFNSCHSGTSCWKTDLDDTYNASSNQDLLSPPIDLTGFSAPVVVRWAQRHQIETATNDHMFVDAQQVGGATPVRLYEWLDGTPISAPLGTGSPQENIGASAGWGLHARRADSLAGLNSELRFHLDSNATVNFGGLAVDDVSVTACRPLAADLAITKTDGVTTAMPGGSVTYTITASNAGVDPVTGGTVADTFPASLNCTWTCAGAGGGTCTAAGAGSINDTVNLPAGGSVTYTASCTIAASATGSLSNTATVSSTVPDPTPGNNSATDVDTLAGSADTSVNMTVDDTTPTVGSNVTYTVTAGNDGPSDAHSVTVTDLLPNGLTFVSATPSQGSYTSGTGAWTVGTIADNGTATLALVATVNSSQAIVNQASVTAQSEVDPNRSNNSALVAVNAPGLADVQLQETVDDDTPGNGQNVTFTVSAHNDGPTAATNVVVTDNTPAGLTFVSATPSQGTYTSGTGIWNVGTIASGATPTLTVVATVTTASPIFRLVQKTQNEPDYASDNDTDSVSLNDDTVSDLAMSLVASQEPVPQGTTFSYTIVVSNHGPASATNVVVTDALPAGVTLNSATATQGSCSGTTTVTCTLGTLPDGLSANVVLVVTKTVGGNVSNTASVAADQTDPFMPNNSNSETSTPAELTNFRVE
jgi:uncharacterized repeat protein (TIGR01451 family)